jgi:hypothetical protein
MKPQTLEFPDSGIAVKHAVSTGHDAPAEFVDIDGERFVCIHSLETLPTFFLTMVSSGDHWLFTATNGALSAGRGSPETALFPYYTVDKIIDNWNSTGPQTYIQTGDQLWEPFKPYGKKLFSIEQRLYKSINGDVVIFEEVNKDLGLSYRFSWQSSEKFGFVRSSRLENLSGEALQLAVVDGLCNFMAAGVDSRTQQEYSCLTDAYKLSERDEDRQLLIHRMAASLTDEAVPLESLRATTIWSYGWPESRILMRHESAEAYLKDGHVDEADTQRAFRGAFLNAGHIELQPGQAKEWFQIADIEQSQTNVAELQQALAEPAALWQAVCEDINSGKSTLDSLIAASDGQQVSAEEIVTNHHRANVLFNIMRGGVFPNDYTVDCRALRRHITQHKKHLTDSEEAWLHDLPGTITFPELQKSVRSLGGSDLVRICGEYLPLTFSRRHGDPSRPWNRFVIQTKDKQGNDIVGFQGNWRDIFQNWEALAWSFPLYNEGFIHKFLNASTADGYNPYRITADGVDWEEPDPNDPWASIGYWGDHQIIYLLKLLEFAENLEPTGLQSKLNEGGFVFAEVPYEIKSFSHLVRDPNHSIHFNEARNQQISDRVREHGADGKLLYGKDAAIVEVTLLEKLLIPLLVKLSNFVPGGGIWMNTQRPEWNDANNALAGHGLSMVTTCYLHRYLNFLDRLLDAHTGRFECSEALHEFITELTQVFGSSPKSTNATGETRYAMVEALGLSGERYRNRVYLKNFGSRSATSITQVKELIRNTRNHIGATIASNKRTDGLYHAYNILHIEPEARTAEVNTLGSMLEGQVAILSSGAINEGEALGVIEALRKSALYCERRNSYILYADKDLPAFLDYNRVELADAKEIPLLAKMLSAGDTSLVTESMDGCVRFTPELRNRFELSETLEKLAADPQRKAEIDADSPAIQALYEKTFQHRSFTGRSGSMFAYEGLGSIYWHMVSKLMLAVQEWALQSVGTPNFDTFTERYYDIQNGLGFRKTPKAYGAFPADAYSHTPAHAGAQQPGLTGMVKEGILCRFAELGVELQNGVLRFNPRLLRKVEFTTAPSQHELRCSHAQRLPMELPENALLFTIAQTPVVYVSSDNDQPRIEVQLANGQSLSLDSDTLSADLTNDILYRSGRIESVTAHFPEAQLIH